MQQSDGGLMLVVGLHHLASQTLTETGLFVHQRQKSWTGGTQSTHALHVDSLKIKIPNFWVKVAFQTPDFVLTVLCDLTALRITYRARLFGPKQLLFSIEN